MIFSVEGTAKVAAASALAFFLRALFDSPAATVWGFAMTLEAILQIWFMVGYEVLKLFARATRKMRSVDVLWLGVLSV